jgi:hypothetical protein
MGVAIGWQASEGVGFATTHSECDEQACHRKDEKDIANTLVLVEPIMVSTQEAASEGRPQEEPNSRISARIMVQMTYHGPYGPLDGRWVSQAYASTLNISLSVRAGLLVRQMHHWGADVFIGSIVVYMGRVLLTGGFRRPRELNWYVGVSVVVLAILNGFLGYSLPDDLISGTGLRIAYSIVESIPVVGSYLAFFFDGNFPGGRPSSPACTSSTSC